MSLLTHSQTQSAIKALDEFLAAAPGEDGRSLSEAGDEVDELRRRAIDQSIRPLVMEFLSESVDLADFRTRIISLNQRNDHWGFLRADGRGFFEASVVVAPDIKEFEREIREAIAAPTSENGARDKLSRFISFAERHGAALGAEGGPAAGSIPYFLSWFWQVQDRDTWPVQHPDCVDGMVPRKLFVPTADLASDYLVFKQTYEELADAFKNRSGRFYGHYEVERVFRHAAGRE